VDILRDYGLAARTTLHSFDIDVVRLLARVAPEFERMISVNADWAARQGGIEYVIEQVRDLVGVIAIEQDLLEAEFTRITALWPLERISVWTVNDPASIADWLARGPGYLTSDDPKLALAIQTAEVTA
jgi:glycerophosphoryl diester phosphodiesterase